MISPDSRRSEPAPDEAHYHVWTDRGFVMIAQPPRFATRQAARQAAQRAGLDPFIVRKCALPCRFTLPRKPRKRRRCKCGKASR